MTIMFLGRRISGRFVIPSGILTTRTPIIERIAASIPQIGVITTKSVGVVSEEGYREPILAESAPLNFINAVGLRSPGMVRMRKELEEMRGRHETDGLFREKFILVSLYGKTEMEFSELIRYLAPVADGFELNFSCPHSKPGYGATIGSHPETTFSFTKAAVDASQGQGIQRPENTWSNNLGHIPIFVKLTPNVDDIGIMARAAIKAGATGITAINTVGPIEHHDPVSGTPVLTHVTGGKSGRWIVDIGARCVNRIREAIGDGIPIIGMGGIARAGDVTRFRGADLYGVGTALAGLDLKEIARFFRTLEADLIADTQDATLILRKDRLMEYRKFTVKEIQKKDDDLRIFVLDGSLEFDPAQFVFLWLPGIGEKPFSPAMRDPLTLAIRKRGIFTTQLFELGPGDPIYVRGPYGRGFRPGLCDRMVILSGGTGSGVALRVAEEASELGREVTVFQGCVNEKQVLFEHQFKKHGHFIPGIDKDAPGEVLKIMRKHLALEANLSQDCQYFTIGPEILMQEGVKIFSEHSNSHNIFASLERETLCGVGLCGACELNGYRTCIRGTVFSKHELDECTVGGFYL